MDVGGTLELDGLPWPKVPLPEGLPRIIPVLGGPLRGGAPAWPAYGVRWSWFMARGGADVRPPWLTGTPQSAARVPPDSAMVLSLVGPDPPIEALWTYQFRNRLWEKIRKGRWNLVIGPNYSVYGDQPRMEHLINIRRSVLAAVRMRLEGIPAVPHVYVWRQADADRVARWAWEAGLDAVAHNCQTYRTRKDWERALALLVWWRDRMPKDVRWFFVGVTSRERIQILDGLFPGSHFLTLTPYQAASHGHRILDDGGQERWPAEPADLLWENIRTMVRWLSG